MENNNWIIVDGTVKPGGTNVVPAESRGLMYGDGCFDTFRSYAGRFLELEKHLGRFKNGIRFLGMEVPELLKPEPFKDLLYKLLVKNRLLNKDAVVRVQAWREGGRGYHTKQQSPAHFSVLAGEYATDNPPKPVTLALADIRRIPDRALPSRFKLSNGINYILASRQAQAKGADDAWMLTMDGYVSETTIANIFWTKDDTIYTPSETCDLLPGITRAILVTILGNLPDLTAEEGQYLPEEMLNAEAVWMCNSVRELFPARHIDGYSFPEQHPVFEKVRKAFNTYRDQNLSPLR